MKALIRICFAVLVSAIALDADTPAVRTVGEPVELTKPGGYYMAPKWSPRGGTIAVTGPRYTGIYLLDFPDGDVVQLSDDPTVGFGMAWSHEGNEIATRIARFENQRRSDAVAVFDVFNGQKRMVTNFVGSLPGTPKWTRDDQYIYLSGTDEFRLLQSGSTLRRGAPVGPMEPVIYAKGSGIYTREVVSQTEVAIRQTHGRILNLTISPDGTKLAFEVIGGAIWVTDIDGGNPVDLGIGDTPAWSSGSDKLAFAVTTDDGHQILTADIFVVNADGTGKVNLTDTPDVKEMNPSWSPDGHWIAYGTLDKGRILVQEVR